MPPKKRSAPAKSQSLPLKTAVAPPNLFVGTSGWAYPTWKPGFYPAAVSTKNFLPYYASQLNSVEVNYTFTKLPTPEIVSRWLAETGAGFRFTFKAPQRITHFSRLLKCEGSLEEFYKSIAPVGEAGKLGMILFQLPPNFKLNLDRMRSFLDAAAFRILGNAPIAFEFRHASWFCEETTALLRERNAAFCIAETDDLLTPEIHPATAHTYFRLRRSGGYKPREIAAFVERIRPLTAEREVFVYFKHEDEPTGALNAHAFLRKAGK